MSEGHFGRIQEYAEVVVVIALVTLAAWFVPIDYRAFGDIYLLAVIMLCLRVGRVPVLFATVLSVVAWNFVIVPPRMSFSRLDIKDGVFLGMYFFVALVAGQLTARFREQQRREHQREQRATALFHLTRAMSVARTLEEAVESALSQAARLFNAPAALFMRGESGELVVHPASAFAPTTVEMGAARAVASRANGAEVVRVSGGSCHGLQTPVVRGSARLGVFALRTASDAVLSREHRELIEAFAAQIGLLIERERLREASEREKLLAESDRLHRTLLDSVSHELKTPVAVLRSAAESLTQAEGARRQALAAEVQTAARRLDHLVANLLNQSRIEAGRVKPQMDWCDPRDLISAARRAVGAPLSGRPIAVEVSDEMSLCMADAFLMEHVLSNLLLNAVHHTPPGTPIRIVAGHEPSTRRVYIAVADRGPGVPPALREKLFQKFERGDRARPGGLGLGLSIVRGFMLAQGGDVTVDENPGGGARFTLYLRHQLHDTVPPE